MGRCASEGESYWCTQEEGEGLASSNLSRSQRRPWRRLRMQRASGASWRGWGGLGDRGEEDGEARAPRDSLFIGGATGGDEDDGRGSPSRALVQGGDVAGCFWRRGASRRKRRAQGSSRELEGDRTEEETTTTHGRLLFLDGDGSTEMNPDGKRGKGRRGRREEAPRHG